MFLWKRPEKSLIFFKYIYKILPIAWALPDKTQESVALFIYTCIYCRYLAPGKIIIHDRGPEFCNKVVRRLNADYGVDVNVCSAGRPQGNGQAESMVKNIKNKLKMQMYSAGKRKWKKDSSNISFSGTNSLPHNWDTVLLPCALQAVRCDPASAHGFAPAALMLGRPLFYPIEIKNREIDLTGNVFLAHVFSVAKNIFN